jgi:uncharacterized NAD(P)/FAD-binding protein YdhS
MKEVAIVGSGSSVIGYLDALRKKLQTEKHQGLKITVFEKSQIAGSGLPYDKTMTSAEHLFNSQSVSTIVPIVTLKGVDQVDRMAFFEWLKEGETKAYLRKEFENIFFERFKKAYRNKFGSFDEDGFLGKNIFTADFEESDFYKENAAKEGFVEMLQYHRTKFENYAKKIEADARDTHGFLPRIVYGFYSKVLFDYQVAKLRELGVEVEVRCGCEVALVKQVGEKILVQEKDADSAQVFDHCFVSTGLWQQEESPYKNPNYVHNIWPASHVEELIAGEIKKAKAEGRASISIGILGASLSAYDMFRTCFKDGMVVDGVAIHVDMCSRNGRFQRVKDSFNWLGDCLTRHMPKALANVMNARGLEYKEGPAKDFYANLASNISNLMRQEMDKNLPQENQIHLYQVLAVFLEVLSAAYENNKDEAAALKINDLRLKLLENKDNYKETISLFKSLEIDQFEQLASDLKFFDGDNIFLNIFNLFDTSAKYFDYLPDDEQLFFRKFAREFLGPTWAAMPPETAQDLLEKHKAGHLELRKLGRAGKLEVPDEGQMAIFDSQGAVVKYDIAINAASAKLKTQTTSTLYQSISENFADPLRPKLIEFSIGTSNPEKFLTEKYGKEFGMEMLNSCEVSEAEGQFVLRFKDVFLSGLPSKEKDQPLVVSRATSSVLAAMRSGAEAAKGISFC